MSEEKDDPEDRVEEMRQLHEGVGAAKKSLEKVIHFLGVATKKLKIAANTQDATPESKREDGADPK